MRRVSWLNIVLIGLVILLVVLLIDSNSCQQQAVAQAVPGAAGGVIAVTGRYDQFGDVLYVVDTNQQTLLAYAYYRPSSGASTKTFEKGQLRLLAGRIYKWDSLAAEKVTIGTQTHPTVSETKAQALKK